LMGCKRIPGNGAVEPMGFLSETLQRRVACESDTELRVFSWLENSSQVRWYQEQPVAIPYELAGMPAHYYPDAAVWDTTGRVVIIEVKPLFTMYRLDTLAKAIAALDHFGPRGIGYLLIDAAGRTLSDLACIGYDMEVVRTVESLFVHGPVSFRLERDLLRMRCGGFEVTPFVSMVVNRDWGVTRAPGVRIYRLPDGLSFGPLTFVADDLDPAFRSDEGRTDPGGDAHDDCAPECGPEACDVEPRQQQCDEAEHRRIDHEQKKPQRDER